MDSSGNIRELTEEKPLKANEVRISELEKELLEQYLTRQQRRAIYRKLSKETARRA